MSQLGSSTDHLRRKARSNTGKEEKGDSFPHLRKPCSSQIQLEKINVHSLRAAHISMRLSEKRVRTAKYLPDVL